MTPLQLARKFKSPAHPPYTVAMEKLLLRGRPTWYASQKQHWLGWLGDYASPGAYGRKLFDHSGTPL
jgi:hypothetical protein